MGTDSVARAAYGKVSRRPKAGIPIAPAKLYGTSGPMERPKHLAHGLLCRGKMQPGNFLKADGFVRVGQMGLRICKSPMSLY